MQKASPERGRLRGGRKPLPAPLPVPAMAGSATGRAKKNQPDRMKFAYFFAGNYYDTASG